MPLPEGFSEKISVSKIKPNVFDRLRAEWGLMKEAKAGDIVLCFGNLPPLLPVRGHVFVFLQNRCLVEDRNLKGYELFTMIRLYIERIWLRFRKSAIDKIVVQTPTMKALTEKSLKIEAVVLPIYNAVMLRALVHSQVDAEENIYDFIYVADSTPHKNHKNLIMAWNLLADEDIYPSLCLTLEQEEYESIIDKINLSGKLYKDKLRITNVGTVNHSELLKLYQRSRALVYPSIYESFGIPLYEARELGIPVIASEMDYVRDIVKLEESFDPCSPVSIKRAIKRFLNREDKISNPLGAEEFLNKIFEIALN